MKLKTVQLSASEISAAPTVRSVPPKKSKWRLIVDLFSLLVICASSYALIFNILNAPFFFTGYGDWLIQAFRVRYIGEYGLTSWTHIWSNGISLWRAYQFLPHVLTAAISSTFNLEITRTMVILTVIQFVLLRFFVYTLARSQKFSAITSLLAVILSYAIGQYWGGVNDYSILFGFTIFPIYVWLWIKYTSGKVQFLFPYLLGVGFYIHPLLGLYAAGLWGVGLLFASLHRPAKKVLLAQIGVFVISSSLFWIQHLSASNKNFSSPFFVSLTFFKQTLSNFHAYGLSFALVICLALLWLTLPITSTHKWAKALVVYATLAFLAVFVSLHIQLPEILASTQYSRGMTFIGIAIVIAALPLLEKLKKSSSSAVRYLLIICTALTVVEAVSLASAFSPHSGTSIEDPVSALTAKYPDRDIFSARIWTPFLDSANYKAAINQHYPVSYMTHSDANQVAVRFSNLLLYNNFQDKVAPTTIERVKQYMKITATKYIIFEKNSPFTRTLVATPDPDLEDLGDIELTRNIYHAFALNEVQSVAVAINSSDIKQLVLFPGGLKPADPQDQIALDDYVAAWVTLTSRPENQFLPITYPSQDSLDVSIPASHISSTIYIPESYSPNWQATFNGKKAVITPVGPNFMRVDFTDSKGYGLLSLKHSWPTTWYASATAIAVLPIIALFYHLIKKINQL